MLNLPNREAPRGVDCLGDGGIDPALDYTLGIGVFFRRQLHRADEELRQRIAGVARIERQPLIDDRRVDFDELAQPSRTEVREAEIRFQTGGDADHRAGRTRWGNR